MGEVFLLNFDSFMYILSCNASLLNPSQDVGSSPLEHRTPEENEPFAESKPRRYNVGPYDRYKLELCDPYKWPQRFVAGVINYNPISLGVINLLIAGFWAHLASQIGDMF